MRILPYLETFSAVVENGSFTAAAEALGISRPVVSKQVSLLERHLGVQLLHRTTRRLHLTHAGEVFASYSHRIMSDVREAATDRNGTQVCRALQVARYARIDHAE